MTIYTELRTWLLSRPGVSALVVNRMYPLFIPGDATYPAIRFERDGTDRTRDYDGQGKLVGSSMQIDAIDDRLSSAVDLAAAIKTELLSFRGAMGSMLIQRTDLEAEFEAWDSTIDKWRASQSWTLWHNED